MVQHVFTTCVIHLHPPFASSSFAPSIYYLFNLYAASFAPSCVTSLRVPSTPGPVDCHTQEDCQLLF